MNRRWQAPPWWATVVGKLQFIAELQHVVDDVAVCKPAPSNASGFTTSFAVSPTGLDPRNVRIEFGHDNLDIPRVFVNGPAKSPHRYTDGSLCMWYPSDPPELRWSRCDGAGALVGCIALHLLREQWWRETAEWVGPEAPHATPPKHPRETA